MIDIKTNSTKDGNQTFTITGKGKEMEKVVEFFGFTDKKSKAVTFSGLFKGRLRRINFFLGHILLVIVFAIIAFPISLFQNETLTVVTELIVVWTLELSLLSRRWHDIGRDGWTTLFFFVPFLNIFAIYWVLLSKGQTGDNKYGSEDKVIGLKSILGTQI